MTPRETIAALVALGQKFRHGKWMPISDWNRYAVMEENHPHERFVCTFNQKPVSLQGRKSDPIDYCGADRTTAEFICAAKNAIPALESLLAESGEAVGGYCWLIEARHKGEAHQEYATCEYPTSSPWTADPFKAARFISKEAATRVLADLRLYDPMFSGTTYGPTEVNAVEHHFAPAPATIPVSELEALIKNDVNVSDTKKLRALIRSKP